MGLPIEFNNPIITNSPDLNLKLFESVQVLLNELPEEQRTAYILCEVDTKNYDEIANITGVPVGTVRSRIFRARQYLMENLKDRL